MTPAPARVGDSVDAIDTPALVVDLTAFEHNLARMAAFAAEAGIGLRPHAKTHRCPAVALRQVAAGALGQCVQTVGEAEAMVAGGIGDVICTNQILGPSKLDRLARLARTARIGLLVDSQEGVERASQAAVAAGAEFDILVEIEVGMGRCGVAPGRPAAALARRVADAAGLRFRGLQAYNGRAQHIRSATGRRDAVARAAQAVRETQAALAAEGLTAAVIGGAGTGTFRHESAAGCWTEIQVGSYVFMDREYAELEDESGRRAPEFQHSLFVLAEIISTPSPGRAIANAGLKVLTTEQGRPLVFDHPDIEVTGVSDEHAVLTGPSGAALALGQRLRLIPGHCDPTVNLHDWIVAVREGRVEEVWPVAARGASR
ncbi:DSD1 family PLP-dependent enzyme [Enterovirga sp.]|uniref:DSD1 family PLP-dependent enzyme n=1 Tax=Enterovirga sp. TaxID=2026350 RepID=UPI0026320146|nr:DSD1 family PLP-dependent enzyme [Enterovirga sp.]MDB5590385.1 alanine racemase [Enterovirga sp.]